MKKLIAVVDGKSYDLGDMQKWYVQIRGFPSILVFGHGKNGIMGEGQSGGRYVSSIAKRCETYFVSKMGLDAYQKAIDDLMIKAGANK
jgi:hypothetical protein